MEKEHRKQAVQKQIVNGGRYYKALTDKVIKRCIILAMYTVVLLCMTRVKLFGSESIDGKVWSLGADSAV